MNVSITEAGEYIVRYIQVYRDEYKKFIDSGYPDLNVSEYLYSNELFLYLANDGSVLASYTSPPNYQWEVAGGPAIMVDYPDSRTPKALVELLKTKGINGKNVGIYRVVSNHGFTEDIWRGKLPQPVNLLTKKVDKSKIFIYQFDISWDELIKRLTFGAFNHILDIHLPDENSHFWNPYVIRRLGFFPADRNNKRFFSYLELLPHMEMAAWDVRTIKSRVSNDIRRDFAYYIGNDDTGGIISFGYDEQILPFYDRLTRLNNSIIEFEKLLNEEEESNEEVFHNYLKANPIILDIYGEMISKPRFKYPPNESPFGKDYVEPDFILKYPLNQYRLIELEKPSKRLVTQAGQPRSELTQASFQIAEWKAYIKNHYDLIKEKFPSINFNCTSSLIISRTTEDNIGVGKDWRKYKELLREYYAIDEVLTYDDLIIKSRNVYEKLCSLLS